MGTVKLPNILFFWIAFATATAATYESCDDCIDRATIADLEAISLRLYLDDIDQYETVLVGSASDFCEKINVSNPTVFYIHGYTEGPDSESSQTIASAYIERGHHNIILVDWRVIAGNSFYAHSARSVDGVGWTVAGAIDELVAACLNLSTIHVIGHSLGAQTAGFIGRYMNSTLERITGLDPAGPGYYFLIDPLTAADAKRVDLFHTDIGVFGTAKNTGTVDVYFNGGGSPQPGCVTSGNLPDACSHARSWKYWAESVINENAFMSVACSSQLFFVANLCKNNPTAVMGYGMLTNVTGMYFLQTNGESPYSRGVAGKTWRATTALRTLF